MTRQARYEHAWEVDDFRNWRVGSQPAASLAPVTFIAEAIEAPLPDDTLDLMLNGPISPGEGK